MSSTSKDASHEIFIRKNEGFSIKLSGGFILVGQNDGFYLLGSKTVPGMIFVKPHYGVSEASLNQGIKSGYQDEGVYLTPSKPGIDINTSGGIGKVVEVTGILDGAQVQGVMAGYVGKRGQGLLIICLTTPNQWSKMQSSAQKMVNGVQLFSPDISSEMQAWRDKFRGMQLTYMSTFGDYSGGGSSKTVYYLCSNGSFLYQDSSSMSFDIDAGFGHQHNSGQGIGQWKLQSQGGKALIVFNFNDGNSQSYALTLNGTKTYLNDTRYFVTQNEKCP